jgi:hypothetical protein
MTETDVVVETSEAQVEVVKSFVIPLKGGCGHVTLEDADAIPIEMYRYIFQQGLETVVNSVGMSKLLPGITKLVGAEAEKAKDAVRKQARANVQALLEGTLKTKGARAKAEVSGAVQTEALRIAKEMVKDLIRSNGQKIGAYKASEITTAAKELIADNPDIVKKAKANLDERAEGAKTTKSLDLKKMFGAKAESEEVKAKPKWANLKKAREAKEGKGEGAVRAKPDAVTGDKAKVAPRATPKGKESGVHHTAH